MINMNKHKSTIDIDLSVNYILEPVDELQQSHTAQRKASRVEAQVLLYF